MAAALSYRSNLSFSNWSWKQCRTAGNLWKKMQHNWKHC